MGVVGAGVVAAACWRQQRGLLQKSASGGLNDTRASMDECINEDYNPQREVSASGVTKPKDRVLRDKTNVAHHGKSPKKNKGAGKPDRRRLKPGLRERAEEGKGREQEG